MILSFTSPERHLVIPLISLTGFVRVRENLESPGILFWHFQDWKVLEKGHWSWKFWKSVKLYEASAFESLYGGQFTLSTQLIKPNYLVTNMKCMEGSKENKHCDLGSVGVHVNVRTLEKPSWVLEKSWKVVSEKGYEPC